MEHMLEDGVTEMGAMHRGYDKHGKRVHQATPTMDNSNKHAVKSSAGIASQATSVDSNTTRVKGGLN